MLCYLVARRAHSIIPEGSMGKHVIHYRVWYPYFSMKTRRSNNDTSTSGFRSNATGKNIVLIYCHHILSITERELRDRPCLYHTEVPFWIVQWPSIKKQKSNIRLTSGGFVHTGPCSLFVIIFITKHTDLFIIIIVLSQNTIPFRTMMIVYSCNAMICTEHAHAGERHYFQQLFSCIYFPIYKINYDYMNVSSSMSGNWHQNCAALLNEKKV